tara:strand:+ start:283 stop:636 length:354 start_codon:yes stop_codon:yes gene_type:complete
MIKYKIVEVNQEDHSIVVRFYSDAVTEAALASQWGDAGQILRCRTDYNIDLPIPAPTGAALAALISEQAPTQWLKQQELILDPLINTSLEGMKVLVGVEAGVMEFGEAETIYSVRAM